MLVGSVALIAGLIIGIGVPAAIGAPFALLGWLVLGAMVAVSGVLAQVPMASVELPPAMAVLLAALTALTIASVAWRVRGGRRPGPADGRHAFGYARATRPGSRSLAILRPTSSPGSRCGLAAGRCRRVSRPRTRRQERFGATERDRARRRPGRRDPGRGTARRTHPARQWSGSGPADVRARPARARLGPPPGSRGADPSARRSRRGTGHARAAISGRGHRRERDAGRRARRRSIPRLAGRVGGVDTPPRGRGPPGPRRYRHRRPLAARGQRAGTLAQGRTRGQRHVHRARRPLRRATAAAHRGHRGRRRPDPAWRVASADPVTRDWTCSRWRTTAAGRPRPRHGWTPSSRAWRSSAPGPAIPTAIPRPRPWHGCGHMVPACSAPTSTATSR